MSLAIFNNLGKVGDILDVLTALINSGIINIAAIENYKAVNEKEKFISNHHKAKISEASDGRWKTYVEVDGKRKLVAKTKREDLIDYLYTFYGGEQLKEQSKTKEKPKIKSKPKSGKSFEDAFAQFLDYKKNIVEDNTILRYEYDYKRYFENTEFARKSIENLKKQDIEIFIVQTIKDKKLSKKAYESFYGCLRGTFMYMFSNELIDKNPMERMQRKDYYRHCETKPVDMERRIASDGDIQKITQKIREFRTADPKMTTGYAVQFATLTGMRVGEIAALTWDKVDFENGVITVDKAEIRNQKTKEYRIDHTKNNQIRYVPITPAIEKLLKELREVEEEQGFLCEFVFAGRHGRIHKSAISCYARNMSYQVGIKPKSIHTFRRTINSKVRSQGLDVAAAASMFGHTETVNEQFYTYDISSMEVKRKALEQAQPV